MLLTESADRQHQSELQQVPRSASQATLDRPWRPRSLILLVLFWAVLQIGGLFTPGLLDDVDSIYIEIAREMLRRHDYVTPYINGIRFFDKPPLMYWMAAASMHVFGVYDWAARLPLALCVLALLLSTYALGIRLFRSISPAHAPDRGGFYASLALASSIGPYLYTRFYIPDILLALWMTLAVHLFLIALDRIRESPGSRALHLRGSLVASAVGHRASDTYSSVRHETPKTPREQDETTKSSLLPCLGFAAVLAFNVLTKGLIGLVFPIAFVLLYLAITGQLRLLRRFHLLPGTLVFLAIAAPWHILAALRTPAIAMPPGLGLPTKAGWAWFYLYNEHIARFLSRRIPHDYGLTPIWLFWLYLAIWAMPWTTFLPAAVLGYLRTLQAQIADWAPHLRDSHIITDVGNRAGRDPLHKRVLHIFTSRATDTRADPIPSDPCQTETALSLLLWAGIVLLFFSISNRQEYYSLPAIPALALIAAGLLARADAGPDAARHTALRWHLFLLVPVTLILSAICTWFALTAHRPAPGTDISTLLAANPEFYNLSLGHLFDLTGAAMGLFRGPLVAVALSMLLIGPGSFLLRRANRTYAANLTLAAAMTFTLLAAHEGLVRFYPILGSKQLAQVITRDQQDHPSPGDLIILDGELTSGSTLIFYTGQQVHLVNGQVNGLWFGSFWPDAPRIFESESSLRQLWQGPRRIFLFTSNPAARTHDLNPYATVQTLASAGGKTILTNH